VRSREIRSSISHLAPKAAGHPLSETGKARLGCAGKSKEIGSAAMPKAEARKTSDFSRIADRYDATREMPSEQLSACYQRLARRGLLPAQGTIVDVGCGTGQISLTLAELGYEVRGYDISATMVAIARAKCRPEWKARYAVGDVRSLPESDGACSAVVVSKLFQHVQDWQSACRELLRVLRPGGCLIELNDRGAFGNSVRRHFAGCADGLGHTQRYVGLNPHDRDALITFFLAQDCEHVSVDTTDLRWRKAISYGEALDQLRERLFAEFWYLPNEAYERILADTAHWVDLQPEGRNKIEELAPYLSLQVFRKPFET
jgi:ubiquinone/menaquinone biosynthesis C-methylase UbiE